MISISAGGKQIWRVRVPHSLRILQRVRFLNFPFTPLTAATLNGDFARDLEEILKGHRKPLTPPASA
jgi:hypothetical protein